MYAIVGITEYYGPRTEKMVQAFSATKAAADQYVEILNRPGPAYLSQNQAGKTSYAVRRIDVARCARGGVHGSPMYLGTYLPSTDELAKYKIFSLVPPGHDAAADEVSGIIREHY